MCVGTHALGLVRLRAGLVDVFRLRRATLDEPDRAEDVEEELKVLRLPVLRHVHREVGRRQIGAEGDRIEVVGHALIVEVRHPGERLADQAVARRPARTPG